MVVSIEASTPRASLESSTRDSSRDNTSSATRTLLNTSSVLLSNLTAQSSKEGEPKQTKLQSRGYNSAEFRMKLKADMIAKLEQEAQKNASGLTCTSVPVQQKLCMNMLSNGKPKSFIEFFNLTHSSEEASKNKDGEQKVLSPEYLSDLSGNLVEAELATRSNDSEKLCHINYAIANIFEKSGDYHKAVYYLSRSLTNSKQAENCVHEAKVKFSLGKVYVKLGDCFNAMTWFEEYLHFARDSQNNESLVLGSKHLLEVYQMSAKEARCKGGLEKSIDLYQKSIQMAEICSDSRAKAEAKYEMGLLHQMQLHLDLALQYQTDYLDFCCSEKDQVGQSKAHAALAKTQELMGETGLAIQHLEALLDVSQHVNLETQAGACCKLGMMYNKQHLYKKALLYFEMFFKLACTLKNPKLIDAARLNLGYVKNILHNSDGSYSMQQVT